MNVVLPFDDRDGAARFDEAQCRAAGTALAERYRTAEPFPHIVIDDFIDPAILRTVAAAYPDRETRTAFDRDQERHKYQYAPEEIDDAGARNLLAQLNARPFLAFLEELTGIGGLVPDPYFTGGGLHETLAGGHLGVHADFNVHRIMRLERRLNLLIYLNDDWRPEWGGDLELWDKAMTGPVAHIAPVMGRAVVFNTALDSFHGHPSPLACPPDRSRRSIATYYYTAPEQGVAALPSRTTNFRVRPGTEDRPDRRVAFEHFVRDWIPHRLQPLARRLNRFR
ncbi:2OG-Fe(II) oxygenase [Sphingomonas montanisoli]|uniref:2OG-Fe(II) oxygenase n=1 Tax=Sphingomonas montanisoli TaxID=2606412 RepID=A0A5D9CAU9_9SPHN|nr:2OG-Fe(II) oxygenase [Sphingomonas montanisoli]TZG29068.1 2OG-Fe(II) oxygenase [Sphingomonas montanisoli]